VSLLRLVLRNATRRPVRSALLVVFTALSAFLGCFLRSVVTTLGQAVSHAATNRLTVQSAVSLFAELPASYRDAIRAVPGVESVNRWSWFGGVYRDGKNFFPRMAVDFDVLFRQYPEILVDDAAKQDLVADRRGCLVGEGLADQFGFRVGDTIPIMGTNYPKPDGGAWDFTVRGIYRVAPDAVFNAKVMFLSWDFVDEVRRANPDLASTGSRVSFFWVKVAPGHDPSTVMAAIDARYAGGPTRTLTQTEAAFRASRIQALGNITGLLAWIGAAVIFAVVLSVGNAMAMAAVERSREAGILMALGFRSGTVARLVVAESVLLTGVGGVLGSVGARVAVAGFRRLFAEILPVFMVETQTVVAGVVGAALVGLVAGLAPAVRQARLRPLEVLRRAE
jgi:putative ABC transport system permease protein